MKTKDCIMTNFYEHLFGVYTTHREHCETRRQNVEIVTNWPFFEEDFFFHRYRGSRVSRDMVIRLLIKE